MTAFSTDRATLTGFHSLKGDRWGVVLQISDLPDRVAGQLKRLHHAEPVMLVLVPHDADDLFNQCNGEVEREQMTVSRRNKLAVQRLWVAQGCKGSLEEFYAARSAEWRAQLEREAQETSGGEL